ncbi:muscular LMNA-interacting protein isoform X2 [Carcharodon carcharias]|uniref:muscular LMNA-interacting protein isoform X2 n=1 Tax=Carcharodon carcharias TaxID=13397 RepID=UPI001B7DC63B|nr:muscular LMNA-interacting protein isoform X2 [Carcharodon carcharias]
MKSAVHVNETAKPLAFTFVPTVRRLPVHIQVIDTTRSSPQPGKQQKPEANSSIMNEPLHITEEMPSADVRMSDTIGGGTPRQHMEIGQSWLNKEGEYVPAEEAAPVQGIFKAELVFLADSYGSDSDCLSRGTEAEVNLSAKTLPLLSLSPKTFADDKSSSIRAKVVVGESKAPLLQDAEQKVDDALQEPFFQAIDEAISDLDESAAANTSEKTHSQFLFESESLRQQSEELYATIEQLLEDPLPTCCSSSAPKSLQKPQDAKAHKHVSPTLKSVGRETKYANLHLSVLESTENRPTRPGVIRPVAIVQKTPATPKMEESGLNPFRQCLEETSDTEIKEPRHSIMTIHENEALGINELTHVTTKLNRDQHQSQGRRRESERSLLPNTDSNQEVLMIMEEELEQAVKT